MLVALLVFLLVASSIALTVALFGIFASKGNPLCKQTWV